MGLISLSLGALSFGVAASTLRAPRVQAKVCGAFLIVDHLVSRITHNWMDQDRIWAFMVNDLIWCFAVGMMATLSDEPPRWLWIVTALFGAECVMHFHHQIFFDGTVWARNAYAAELNITYLLALGVIAYGATRPAPPRVNYFAHRSEGRAQIRL